MNLQHYIVKYNPCLNTVRKSKINIIFKYLKNLQTHKNNEISVVHNYPAYVK